MLVILKSLNQWKEILTITLIVKIILLIVSSISSPNSTNIFYPWVRWDGPHYIDLAQYWYQSFGQESLWVVFYPFYPILIKTFNLLFQDFSVSSVFVSIIFNFSASIFLFELAVLDFGKKTAIKAVWLLNIYPTAYFLQSSYTESLFLTTSLASVYFLRRENNLLSGFFGLLSSLTRINGILLIPLMIIESKNFKKTIQLIILTLIGLLIYLFINYITFGNFFYFTKPLETYWYKHLDWPWNGISNGFHYLQNYTDEVLVTYLFEFITLIFTLIVTIFTYFKTRKSYGIYMLLNILLFTSTSFVLSVPRYSLILFPIFITLAKIKSNISLTVTSISFIILLIYFTYLYTQGKWAF